MAMLWLIWLIFFAAEIWALVILFSVPVVTPRQAAWFPVQLAVIVGCVAYLVYARPREGR